VTRYDLTFKKLADKKEGAFIPFVVLGDPTPELSLRIIQTLIDAGADALELGLAFSDPVADGPVIQRADMRVLANKFKTSSALEIIRTIRSKNADIPIGILTYANLVVNRGADAFYRLLEESGVDSLLIADVPTLEIAPFLEHAKKHNIAQVMIVPPNIDNDRLALIAQESSGYVYVVTRSGVTGADASLSLSSQQVFSKLVELRAPPGVYGFGISAPEHVKQALKAGAAGAISGSAITAIIEKNLGDSEKLLREVSEFVKTMKAATSF
jgi:tryptophan synthase alpha chain